MCFNFQKMKLSSILTIIWIIVDHQQVYMSLVEGGNHVCNQPVRIDVNHDYKYDNIYWFWFLCNKGSYIKIEEGRILYCYRIKCCSGWTTQHSYETSCNYAICGSRINPTGACNLYYRNDVIIYRGGFQRSSGGSCTQPETCTNCNDGFYSSGSYCEICPKIDHCLHRRCSSTSDNICMYCEGEIKDKDFWRAYTPHYDNRTSCREACSWRSSSTRCYPGSCQNHLAAHCRCISGFGGKHCEKILDPPDILFNEAKLGDDRTVLYNPVDSNNVDNPQEIIWTNHIKFSHIDLEFKAKYVIKETPAVKPDPDGEDHYVTEWKNGIISGSITLNLIRNNTIEETLIYMCPKGSRISPINNNYICAQSVTFETQRWPSFEHGDQLKFIIETTNGGYVDIIDRENDNKTIRHWLEGQIATREYIYQWDMVDPYHCVEMENNTDSCPQPVTTSEITDNPILKFSWSGWNDDLSQIGYYSYELYDLGHSNSSSDRGLLSENNGKQVISSTLVNATISEDTLTLSAPGMYSLIFTVVDKAGNSKSTRAVFLYDDKSVVNKHHDKITIASTATKITNYTWVTQKTRNVRVEWIDRFYNKRHIHNRWLNEIKPFHIVNSEYDDLYGQRSVARIENIHACVDFQVAYQLYDASLKQQRAFVSVSNIYDQSTTLTGIQWEDGDKLDITVRAFDALNTSAEDNITVYRDTTSPILDNLWLTREDRVNISVHRIEDFTHIVIEWDAFDYHSGLHSVYWKMYDNYTGDVVLHGHEDLPAQGLAKDMGECETKYSRRPRGPKCICTLFHGCYHHHFHVVPRIAHQAGLIAGKDRGVHDYDYYIEVSVTNNALLTTVNTLKITIDTSPPAEGFVHDGLKGQPEVDFQQSLTLFANWEGFFDRESGIEFYQYAFNETCLASMNFNLRNESSNGFLETDLTEASFSVTSEGRYYATVIAYNRALEPSKPVCSDGVTISTASLKVKEVSVDNTRIQGGLIKGGSGLNVWVVGEDRTRRVVLDPPSNCILKATFVQDLSLFPLERNAKGDVVAVNSTQFCANTTGGPRRIYSVISKSSMINVKWQMEAFKNGVHDFKFGLSSSISNIAPDIIYFTSTNQHSHYMLHHADIPDGLEFYIVIQTISKWGTEYSQHVGPFILDTTEPVIDQSEIVSVMLIGDILVASWSPDTFLDDEEPYQLQYEYAIGTSPKTMDIQKFRSLNNGDRCNQTINKTCTEVKISSLEWYIHGHHSYYFLIKAENTAGLSSIKSSEEYIHNVQLPSEGIVFDIAMHSNNGHVDIDDIDLSTDMSSLGARWTGFAHPHQSIAYKLFIGTRSGSSDVIGITDIGSKTEHIIQGLTLTSYQTYYVTVIAQTVTGSVNVTSDGVTIVQHNLPLLGVTIQDGKLCVINANNETRFTHHSNANMHSCEEDIDYQMSLNTLSSHWEIPSNLTFFTPLVFAAVEKKTHFGDFWLSYRDFEYSASVNAVTISDLTMEPGQTYRMVIKFCNEATCFKPLASDGVTILTSSPKSGKINVTRKTITVKDKEINKITVQLDAFYDQDIQDDTLKYNAVNLYEWALTDDSHNGKTHTKWQHIDTYNITSKQITFDIKLDGRLDFSKCRRLAVRGYNRAKIWSAISTEIEDCATHAPLSIVPNLVVDAVGSDLDESEIGKEIYLKKHNYWNHKDIDYTPYSNILSAVWPKLRHGHYKWAVLDASDILDAAMFYVPGNKLNLSDPCSHPDSIKCGTTDMEFVNIEFDDGILKHGHRYIICMHADNTTYNYEKWTETLEEINACSDGVVVDLTPPNEGTVWIENIPEIKYQHTETDMYINWESFHDVEEFGNNPHSTGIKEYELCIGSTPYGQDIVPCYSVGVTNHVAKHNLRLLNGHKYYATIVAKDFVGRVTTSVSDPVTVDTTPPTKSDLPIHISQRHITAASGIQVCWNGVFSDMESGIREYNWSIGSQPGYRDIMDYMTSTEECSDFDITRDFRDGHAYFVNVKAVNNAGLSSIATSWAYTVDTTPPVKGYVYDGNGSNSATQKDADFQSDTSAIYAHWEGFHDPHTPIKEYFISVGTCPECDDTIGYQSVGTVTNIQFANIHLGNGLKYYVTVTACNTADLCVTSVSDGVILDNSPPIPGNVLDGTGKEDIEYQSMRTYLGAKWYGFVDPHSGVHSFSWRAGTVSGGDDVISSKLNHLSEIGVIPSGISLPVGKRIYVTVRAYNGAGLYTESTSDGFYVDTSPPEVSSPTLNRTGSLVPNSIVYRTSLGVHWTAADKESFIERQYLSLQSHIGGDFNMSSIQVGGITRQYFFTGLDLHDGSCYYVTIISCNGAKLCSNATSEPICLDSTPPTRGMFAIHTNHAADLQRHIDGFIFWSRNAIFLSWIGFSDLHSGISHYVLTIGSTYMATDLNKEPGRPDQIDHSEKEEQREGEGYVQSVKLETSNLNHHSHVYISVLAVNKVGLQSQMIHSKFRLLPGGSMELMRRCDAYSCHGHCVCAPQDATCPISIDVMCHDKTAENPNSIISVTDVGNLDATIDIDFTPSDTVLMAKWKIIQTRRLSPLWYEWSIGHTEYDQPEGIFDPRFDRLWHDAGENQFAIFTTIPGKKLNEGSSYSVFVKVWYTNDTFAVFKSDGVVISTKPPKTTRLMGSKVVERSVSSSLRDDDYIAYGSPMRLDWANKFLNSSYNSIRHFEVYLSTYPGGHDAYEVADVVPFPVTSYDIKRYRLTPGRKYYSNVVAYTYSGLFTTKTSDGFVLDDSSPTVGMVYDGIGVRDINFQNSTDICSASWNSFKDTESGIKQYQWRVVLQDTSEEVCPWINVSVRTAASRSVPNSVKNLQGKRTQSQILAINNAGLISPVGLSNGVMLDHTPPVPGKLIHGGENILKNPSFESTLGDIYIDFKDFNKTDLCSNDVGNTPTHWRILENSCVVVVSSELALAKHGRKFAYIRGNITQELKDVQPGLYRVTFATSHLHFNTSVSSNKEVFLQFDKEEHMMLIHSKGYRHDNYGGLNEREMISWHNHTFYFQSSRENFNVTFGNKNSKTGIFIDGISTEKVEIDTNHKTGHVNAHTVFTHNWASIHGSWVFIDPESPIIDYSWAIGNRKGGIQIQNFKSVGLKNFGYNSNVDFVHNSNIYVTVLATNAAGMIAVSYSDPIKIDLTKPFVTNVIDGKDTIASTRTESIVTVSWKADDPESGIDFCEWAIGYRPFGTEIQAFEVIPDPNLRFISKSINYTLVDAKKVYSTIRCQNKAGLQSSQTSDGIVISNRKPSTVSAQLLPMYLSVSQYSAKNGYQSVPDTLRMKWTGFTYVAGIELYKISIEDSRALSIKETLYSDDQDYMYTWVSGLDLAEDLIKVSVQAKNSMDLESEKISVNISRIISVPQTASPSSMINVVYNKVRETITIGWSSVFAVTAYQKYYEVSAGSVLGGADILQWQETKSTNIVLGLPNTTKDQSNLNIYIHIRCITASGAYMDVIKIETIELT